MIGIVIKIIAGNANTISFSVSCIMKKPIIWWDELKKTYYTR